MGETLGTRDVGPFDTDTAEDFGGDLDEAAEGEREGVVRGTLTHVIDTVNDLEAPESEVTVEGSPRGAVERGIDGPPGEANCPGADVELVEGEVAEFAGGGGRQDERDSVVQVFLSVLRQFPGPHDSVTAAVIVKVRGMDLAARDPGDRNGEPDVPVDWIQAHSQLLRVARRHLVGETDSVGSRTLDAGLYRGRYRGGVTS